MTPIGPAHASPAAVSALQTVALHPESHPEPHPWALESQIARHLSVPESSVVVGSGFTQLIELLLDELRTGNDAIVLSKPSFPIYRHIAAARGYRIIDVPLRGYEHDLPALRRAIDDSTRLVILDDPNSSTGQALPQDTRIDALREIGSHTTVLYDNAYGDFGHHRVRPSELLGTVPSAVYGATFSKGYFLLALRVGFVVASEELAGRLRGRRSMFSVNYAGLAAASAALEDQETFRWNVWQSRLAKQAGEVAFGRHGLACVPSEANFLLVDAGEWADELEDMLKERQIPHIGQRRIGLAGHIRVAFPDLPHADRLAEALDVLAKRRASAAAR